jgi:hypothetical protein
MTTNKMECLSKAKDSIFTELTYCYTKDEHQHWRFERISAMTIPRRIYQIEHNPLHSKDNQRLCLSPLNVAGLPQLVFPTECNEDDDGQMWILELVSDFGETTNFEAELTLDSFWWPFSLIAFGCTAFFVHKRRVLTRREQSSLIQSERTGDSNIGTRSSCVSFRSMTN